MGTASLQYAKNLPTLVLVRSLGLRSHQLLSILFQTSIDIAYERQFDHATKSMDRHEAGWGRETRFVIAVGRNAGTDFIFEGWVTTRVLACSLSLTCSSLNNWDSSRPLLTLLN